MFALKDLELLGKALQLPDDMQIPILVYGAIALFGWWVYTKSQSDREKKVARLRKEYEEIYSPAYGLILSHKSGLLSEQEFTERFRDHLIENRSKTSDREIVVVLNKWLQGNGDLGWIHAVLEHKCAKYEKKLMTDVSEAILAPIYWTVYTAGIVFFLGIFMPLVLIGMYSVLNFLGARDWMIPALAGIGVLGALVINKLNKRRLMLRKSELERS